MSEDTTVIDNSPGINRRNQGLSLHEPELGGSKRKGAERYGREIPLMVRGLNLYEDLGKFESSEELETHFDREYQLVIQSFADTFLTFRPLRNLTKENKSNLITTYIKQYFDKKPKGFTDEETNLLKVLFKSTKEYVTVIAEPESTFLANGKPLDKTHSLHYFISTRTGVFNEDELISQSLTVYKSEGSDEDAPPPSEEMKFDMLNGVNYEEPIYVFSFFNQKVRIERRYHRDSSGKLQKIEE